MEISNRSATGSQAVPNRPLSAAAPHAPLQGTLTVPGDKSISHRALMFGALSVGRTDIEGLLEGEDVLATAAALRAFGAVIERTGPGRWTVDGVGVGGFGEPDQVIDMGNSGTGVRLLMGLAAGHDITTFFTGDASLRGRPMRRIITPLAEMGAVFTAREGGRLPLSVCGTATPLPIEYRLPVASAQVKSAVLLAGLQAPGETVVIEPRATRDHTETMARAFGADIAVEDLAEGGRRIRLAGRPELTPCVLTVPADPSSAAFPTVAATIVPGSAIRLPRVGLNPLRWGLFQTLIDMGAAVKIENQGEFGGEPVGDLVVEAAELTGIEVPPERAPSMIDEYPILCVAAACAAGRTVMRGLEELRVKESDRIAAMATGLAAAGVAVEELPDGLIITGKGPPAGGATIATHLDHRIAMSFLVLGLATEAPVVIDDAAPIDTSFPGFAGLMAGIGAEFTGPA